MKDDKHVKKMVPKDITPEVIDKMEWAVDPEPAVAAPEPPPDAVLPTGTHGENLKKCRRPGKA
jgi:hypothetical protein